MYLGADLSLQGTGLVIIDESMQIIAKEKLSVQADGVERLFLLDKELKRFFNTIDKRILLCSIEGPALREIGRLFDLGEWTGVFKLTLYKKNINFIIVAPLQLKKFISGTGKNFGKDTVLLDIYKHYSVEIRDSDIGDAFVLALIAYYYDKVYNKKERIEVKAYQRDVLNKIHRMHDDHRNRLL